MTVALSLSSTVLVYRLGAIFGHHKVTRSLALPPLLIAGFTALPWLGLTGESAGPGLWTALMLLTIGFVMNFSLMFSRRALLKNVNLRRTYEEMLSNISDIFYITDANGLLEYLSPSATPMTGFTIEETLGTPMANLYTPGLGKANTRENFLKAMQDGGGSVQGYQAYLSRKDGSSFPIETNASFRKNMGGEVVGIQGVARDISARVEAERMNKLLGQVVEKSLVEIYIWHAATDKFITVNSSARKNLGYSVEELNSLSLFDLSPSLDEATYKAEKLRLCNGDLDAYTFATTHRRKDGSEYPIELTLQHVQSAQASFIFAHAQDLTERHNAQANLIKVERLQSVAQVTGGVSHEFNNMLQALQMNIELIEPTEDEQHSFRAGALSVIARASTLTQRLKAFSRQQSLDPKNVCLNEVLLAFKDELRRNLDASVDLKILPGFDLPNIYVDQSQLENCLLNLSMNAQLAMPEGGSLTLQSSLESLPLADAFAEKPPATTYVKLAITDTGSGMSQEISDHAVEPFFTTREVGQGMGLGLSMVHGFVHQSGGRILIDSHPAQGTTVNLCFPAVVS